MGSLSGLNLETVKICLTGSPGLMRLIETVENFLSESELNFLEWELIHV